MEPAKQLLWRELLLGDVAAPEPPSFFVTRPTCAAFQRGAPGFVVLDHLLTAKGLQSGPEAQGGRFAEAPGNRGNSRLRGQFLPVSQGFLPLV